MQIQNPLSGEPRLDGPIVCLMLPEHTAINATFTLANRLAARGHRVVYLTNEALARHVRRQGFECDVIQLWWQHDNPAKRVRREQLEPLTGWRRLRAAKRFNLEYHHEAMERLRAWLDRERPAAALLDPLIWGVCVPFLEARIPIIALSATLASTIDVAVPPVSSPIVPVSPSGIAQALRHRVAWLQAVWATVKVAAAYLATLVWASRPWHRDYHTIGEIRRHGVGFGCSEYGPRLRLPELVAGPRAFEFPFASSLARRIYLGNCIGERRNDGPFEWGAIDPAKPLLYCSLGTYSTAYPHCRRLFEAVIEAFRHRSDWQVIVQIGQTANPEAFGSMPSHIRLTSWVPQLEILKHADLFITQGGLGSIREAIHFGVPMIVCPCWYDQPGNAARVAFHGIGLVADVATIDAQTIARLVERVVAEECRERIERLRSADAGHDGCDEAAEAIVRAALASRAAGQAGRTPWQARSSGWPVRSAR